MELGEGRGGLLGEEYLLYTVGEKIQPLSPLTARALWYYRTKPRYYHKRLRYYRCRVRYYRSHGGNQTKTYCTWQRVVELPERYYRAPIRYYRTVGINWHRRCTEVKNYFRAYLR